MKDNLIVFFCGFAFGMLGLKALFYFGRKKMNDLAFRRLEQNLEKTGQS